MGSTMGVVLGDSVCLSFPVLSSLSRVVLVSKYTWLVELIVYCFFAFPKYEG